MAHQFRFIGTPLETDPPGQWVVRDEEHRHATKVLRVKIGDRAEVCNGEGLVAIGQIQSITKTDLIVKVASEQQFPPQTPPLKVLLGALNHGEIDELIAGFSEVGVDELHVYLPFQADSTRLSEKATLRWKRLSDAALKQSKRAFVMPVISYRSLAAALEVIPAEWCLDCSLTRTAQPLISTPVPPNLVGPILLHVAHEAGLNAKDEEALLRFSGSMGCHAVHLGTQILRARTAALVAAAIVSLRRTDQTSMP